MNKSTIKSEMPPEASDAAPRELTALPLDLEFPDAPDFISRRSSVPLDQVLELLDQYRKWFPPTAAQIERRQKNRCIVEFVI